MESIKVILRLTDTPEEYSFRIDRRQNPPVLHIPGDYQGPDVCIPCKPEQVKWLNGLSHLMKPRWDCQWEFTAVETCREFTRYLKEMEIKRKADPDKQIPGNIS